MPNFSFLWQITRDQMYCTRTRVSGETALPAAPIRSKSVCLEYETARWIRTRE
jgi:hypothetical protein